VPHGLVAALARAASCAVLASGGPGERRSWRVAILATASLASGGAAAERWSGPSGGPGERRPS
jgi:hypothetical protein